MLASHRRVACLPALFVTVVAVAQQAVVVPVGAATAEGNNNGGYPWNVGAQGMRQQFVYDSSNFTLQGVTAPVLIQRLRFRPDSSTVTWPGGSWPNVRIDMATGTTDYTTASSNFAANMGTDAIVAYQGAVTVQGGTGTGVGVVQPWHIDIQLTAPFRYDPAAGDLVLDVQLDGAGWTGSSCQADAVMVPNAFGTSVHSVAGPTATTGVVGVGYVLVCEFGYGAANTLQAAFSATPTNGPSPLAVQFSEHSYTSSPSGITSWAWDFDGDGVTDSTQPNPLHTYTGCGDFTVSLTVQDGVHPASTRTLSQYVRTDPIVPSFTATPIGSGNWQCIDATTPPATAWAWDFDDDGIVDSTVQNPIAPLGVTCSSRIRLTATRHCRTATVVMPVLQAPAVQATAITPTTTGTGTTAMSTVANFFDLQVTASEGVLVCGLTTTTHFGFGPYDVDVFVTPASYLGKDGNASLWRAVGHGRGVMTGGTVLQPHFEAVPLDQPFYLPAGTWGISVAHTVPYGWAYMSFSLSAGGPWPGSDLVFHPTPWKSPGLARMGQFSGLVLSPRQWTGEFHYTRFGLNNQGGYGLFRLGCAGSVGVPGNVVRRHPALGRTLVVELTNLANNVAVHWWGVSNTVSAAGPLPLSLAFLGAPGCAVYVSFDATTALLGSGGTAQFSFAIPSTPVLLGAQFFTQGASFDPAANALGFVTSDAAAFVIGQ